MLAKGDFIENVKQIEGAPVKVGEMCEVTHIYDNGNIQFKFGGFHMGVMTQKEYEEYFKKVEVVEEAPVVSADRVNWIIENMEIEVTTMFDKCTVVSAKLPNGFVITESSACVSPENYSQDMGVDICIDKIVDKIWELEGYLLQETLYEEESALEKFNEALEEDDYCSEYDCDGDCDNCLFEEDEEWCGEYGCEDCPYNDECEDYESEEGNECDHDWMIVGLSNDGLVNIVCKNCGEEKEAEIVLSSIIL